MKTVFLTLVAGILLTGQAKLTLDAPGHVYTDRERATARGGAAGAAWTLTDWETRRIDLSVGPSSAKPGAVKALRLGANPKGTTCSFWIRNPRLLKSAR